MPALLSLARQYPAQSLVTTLDAAAQRQTQAAAESHLRELASSGINAAAVVVLDTSTGELLASVSLCQRAAGVDLTERPRSTGSVLKPFIYAAAFEQGLCAPATPLLDSPAAWPGYAPTNYDHFFHGLMPASEAMAQSRNVPALLVLAKVGVPRALGVMESVGIRTPSRAGRDYGLSLAIGGAEATPLEIAAAYACMGRGGAQRDVTIIAQPPSQPNGPSALSAAVCYQTLEALSDPSRTARVCREAAALHVAWKTGTSSGRRDAWCAAVTPRRTVVVWLGNVGGQGSAGLVGVEAAAPLALKLVAALDPGGPAWPTMNAAPVALSTTPAASGPRVPQQLILVAPAPHQEFILIPDSPPERQQVLLQAAQRQPGRATDLWWFIDGQPVAQNQAGEQAWWAPAEGTHQVRVIDAAGHAAGTEIFVRGR